ncbi:MAG: polysulfide reductase NrfD [Candidatus Lambdaproteobacteria bacterium]|nr:polysulfide reductase NrfD [Candidatus Lambdaproteobacteria bacterium]
MNELTTTRSNPLIDPHLHIWGHEVALYLFLGGMVAGIMVLTGLYYFIKGIDREAPGFIRNGMLASPILLSLGMLFLFLDLEHKPNVLRFYLTFQVTSPMSWGSWILIVIYPVSIAMIVLANRGRWWVDWMPALSARVVPYWRAIALANVFFGALLGLYTGILLSSFTARPFWNNGVLPPLFLISGISAGAAWMILFHDGRSVREKDELGLIKLGLIVTEIMALVLYISSMLASAANQHEAVFLVLGGPFTAQFWVFVVGIGLLVPPLLQGMELLHKLESRFVMPLLVLVGGLVLRMLVVQAGQMSHVVQLTEVLR